MKAQTQSRLILLCLFKSLITSISDRRGELTYPSGTTMEMVMAQRSRTTHKENRTPWQDVTSTWDTLTHSQFSGGDRRRTAACVGPPSPCSGSWRWWQKDKPESWCPDTGTPIWCCRSWKERISVSALPRDTDIRRGYVPTWTHLDTNPIMKAMLRVWAWKAERIWPCANRFNVFTRRDTYKEDQQYDIPWKLPPVWMKL